MASKRKSYSADYKLQVAKHAAENGNRASARQFGVNEKLVRDWRKAEATLAAMKKTKKANRGQKARWPELEERVHRWALEQRAAGICLSAVELRLQALVVAKEMNIIGFMAGPSWCTRFMRRSSSVRPRATLCQKLPEHLQAKVDSFRELVEKQMKMVSQHMDLNHKQACIDLEKATQVITQALQREVVRSQQLRVLIRRLEEKEAETGRSLKKQAESNKQLMLMIVELQRHLEENNSLAQANQTVTFLKNELRELHQHLQSQPCIRTGQEVDEWPQGGESQIKPISGPSSPLQSDQLIAEEPLVWLESSDDQIPPFTSDDQIPPFTSDDQIPLVSSDDQALPEAPALLSGVKEENAAPGYEEGSQYEPRMECTVPSAAEMSDVKLEQRQTPLVTSDSQRLLEAPVSEDEDDEEYGEYSHSGKMSSPSPSSTHTRERLFCCSQCGKSFPLQKHLEDHKRIHTGEKPHRCTQCGKGFTQKGNLTLHRRIHTGERPYQCTQCGKSFTQKGSLKVHLHIHTRKKPYQCTRCSKTFAQASKLKQHQLSHTGEG
ncbi:zinc finger protein 397-like [Sardina pilchardus]|uniref:zinc finger protein 397-like n=1 Tax=Sardina pilchardus TaxID=27697 RepID=UPI002E1191D1